VLTSSLTKSLENFPATDRPQRASSISNPRETSAFWPSSCILVRALLAACRLLTTAAALWDRETSAPPHKARRPIQRCGRLQIEKAAQDFNLPDDVATDMELWVWFPCERCGRDAKLHFRRELKPAH
jgi:hypothetical protein